MPHDLSLGPLERDVLDIVWKQGESSVRDVRQELGRRGRPLAYTTVMTILKRLTEKNVLDRHKVGRAYHYEPYQSRELFLRKLAKQTIQELVNNHGTDILDALRAELKRTAD